MNYSTFSYSSQSFVTQNDGQGRASCDGGDGGDGLVEGRISDDVVRFVEVDERGDYTTFVCFGGDTYQLGDVVGIEIYNHDCIVKRNPTSNFGKAASKGAKRDKIYYLSQKSLNNLNFTVQNTAIDFVSMITFTYPEEFTCNGEIVKRDLDTILKRMKREYGDFNYVWVLEFQVRGAPHLHLLTDISLPKRVKIKRKDGTIYHTNWEYHTWLSRSWYEVVGSGDENHLKAGVCWEVVREKDGAKHYIAKYTCKTEQKQVPRGFQNVGRFWSCSREVSKTAKSCRFVEISEKDIREKIGFDDSKALYKVLFGASEKFAGCDSELGKRGLSVSTYLTAYKQGSMSADTRSWLEKAVFSEYEGLTIQEAARKLRKIAISANVIQA